MRNSRAISPVVASIILIAVTVAVSIAVAVWMDSTTTSYMANRDDAANETRRTVPLFGEVNSFRTFHYLYNVTYGGPTTTDLDEEWTMRFIVEISMIKVDNTTEVIDYVPLYYAYAPRMSIEFVNISLKNVAANETCISFAEVPKESDFIILPPIVSQNTANVTISSGGTISHNP